MNRIIPVVLLIVGILLAAFGSAGAQDDQLVFAMVNYCGQGNPFFRPMIKGMDDACDLLEADCSWLSDPVCDGSKMPGYWDEALELNPDGIGTVSDPELTGDGMIKAKEAGIPVIIYHSDNPWGDPTDVLPALTYVGPDEFAGGISNARRIFTEAAADSVQITGGVCYNPFPGSRALQARCDAAQSVFEEEGVPLDHLEDTAHNPAQDAGTLEDYFAENSEVNAILLPLGPSHAQAFNTYLRGADLEPRAIYAVTWDTSTEIFQMIEDGYLLQTMDQQQYTQSFMTIMWLYLNSQFAMAPGGDVLTGPVVIDQSNVDRVIELTAQGYR